MIDQEISIYTWFFGKEEEGKEEGERKEEKSEQKRGSRERKE